LKLTDNRIQILRVIKKLSSKSSYGAAHILAIARELKKTRINTSKALTYLKKDGFVENPLWGYWKLSQKGLKILEELG